MNKALPRSLKKRSPVKTTMARAVIAPHEAGGAKEIVADAVAAIATVVDAGTEGHAAKAGGDVLSMAAVPVSSRRFKRFSAAGTKSSCKSLRKGLEPKVRLFPRTSAFQAAIWS